jgi:hypothetical protein
MLVEAYSAAGRGDFGPLRTLQEVFAKPYAEQPDRHERFYRRTPEALRGKGGVAFYS